VAARISKAGSKRPAAQPQIAKQQSFREEVPEPVALVRQKSRQVVEAPEDAQPQAHEAQPGASMELTFQVRRVQIEWEDVNLYEATTEGLALLFDLQQLNSRVALAGDQEHVEVSFSIHKLEVTQENLPHFSKIAFWHRLDPSERGDQLQAKVKLRLFQEPDPYSTDPHELMDSASVEVSVTLNQSIYSVSVDLLNAFIQNANRAYSFIKDDHSQINRIAHRENSQTIEHLRVRKELKLGDRKAQVVLKAYDNLAKQITDSQHDEVTLDQLLQGCLELMEAQGEVETDAVEKTYAMLQEWRDHQRSEEPVQVANVLEELYVIRWITKRLTLKVHVDVQQVQIWLTESSRIKHQCLNRTLVFKV
jgi:hypothetical protein